MRTFIFCLIVASGIGYAQESTIDREIQELFELTNVRSSLEQIPNEFEKQRNDPPEVRAKAALIRSIIKKNHSADFLYKIVFNQVRQSYEKARIASLLESYRSAFIKKLSDLERQNLLPNIEDSLANFQQTVRMNPPSKERQQLIQRIDLATGSVDMALFVMGSTMRTLALGINPALPPERRSSLSQIEANITRTKTILRPTIQESVYLQLYFTYRSVSDYALSEYAKFLESENARWYSKIVNSAFSLAMKVAGENSRIEIGEALRR